ncbi:MAG: YjbQ family protein [Acidobacteria bacterium]|nr:YjbQ family protein [Acidobacteriota bacterium]
MEFLQKQIRLKARSRGFHVVTREILDHLPELREIRIGLMHLFIQHTSASLTINENVSPDVRADLEEHLNHVVPENASWYEHTIEGPDDMPAHIKASMLGSGLTIPIGNGQLLLGTWQGIYLGEHRDHGGARSIVATIVGEKA